MKGALDKIRRAHLIGIGGAGMEGLARILAAKGVAISGSDRVDSRVLAQLREEGFAVRVGHDANFVAGADLVIYSAAIPAQNPERTAAARLGICAASRAEVLGELSRTPFTLAVAGTHGKTTTASMVAAILRRAGIAPQVLIGGWLEGKSQAAAGAGEVLVVEADEFARSFLHLYPDLALVTGVDAEHLDCYSGLADLEKAFAAFLARLSDGGRGLMAGDGLVGEGLRTAMDRSYRTYGMALDNDYQIADLQECNWGSRFALCFEGRRLGEIELQVHGAHNARNAAGAAAMALEMDVDFTAVAGALAQFSGVDRRFQRKGEVDGVLVVDDYAHHPTELAAVLAAARQSGRRIVAVFQPHLYSRTRDFAADFARELSAADYVVLAEVFAAREEPLPGVDSGALAAAMRAAGFAAVEYVPEREGLVPRLAELCRAGDLVLILGAGDIGAVAEEFLTVLADKTAAEAES
jgi:UDP-N-acetylmuramate--alanine ligase